jgi:hypothetical protein
VIFPVILQAAFDPTVLQLARQLLLVGQIRRLLSRGDPTRRQLLQQPLF